MNHDDGKPVTAEIPGLRVGFRENKGASYKAGLGTLPGRELWEVLTRIDLYGPRPILSFRAGVTLREIKCLTGTSFSWLFFFFNLFI